MNTQDKYVRLLLPVVNRYKTYLYRVTTIGELNKLRSRHRHIEIGWLTSTVFSDGLQNPGEYDIYTITRVQPDHTEYVAVPRTKYTEAHVDE